MNTKPLKDALGYIAGRLSLPLQTALDLRGLGVAVKQTVTYSGEATDREKYERDLRLQLQAAFYEADITPEKYDKEKLKELLLSALLLTLPAIYEAYVVQYSASVGVIIDPLRRAQMAKVWADQYAATLTRQLVDTTSAAIGEAASRYALGEMTHADYLRIIEKLLSKERAAIISATEVTTALSRARGDYWQDILAEHDLAPKEVWFTERDNKVCPVCAPRDGKPKGEGWTAPPPAHPMCRCWTDFVVDLGDDRTFVL